MRMVGLLPGVPASIALVTNIRYVVHAATRQNVPLSHIMSSARYSGISILVLAEMFRNLLVSPCGPL